MGNCFSSSKQLSKLFQPYLPIFCETYLDINESQYTPVMDLLSAFFIFVREKFKQDYPISESYSMKMEDLFESLTNYLFAKYELRAYGFRNSEERYTGLFIPGVSIKLFPRFVK